jgi:FkbM family methyltransferase
MMIVNCRYGDFSIPQWNDLIADSLRLYGEWAQLEIDILANFIGDGDVVIDAGAFIGTHTRAFSKLVGPAGEVLAFEPNHIAFKFLAANISRSRYANIKATPDALGSTEDRRFLGPAVSGNAGHTRLSPTPRGSEHRAVSVKPLDTFGIARVNFIKVDVEGMEHSILEGAPGLINTSKPVIFMEVNTLQDSVPVLNWASSTDYLVFGLLTPAFNPDNFNHVSHNVFGSAKECGLLLISNNQFARYIETVHALSLLEIRTVDDLALLLLHKPQYPHEVLDKSLAAKTLGISYPSPAIDAVNKCLAAAKQSEEKAHTLVDEQQRQIDELKKMHAEAEGLRQEAQQLAHDRQIKINELEKQHTDAEYAKREAQGLAAERQATLDALYASTSWRSTAPLRYLKRLIRLLVSFVNEL